MSTSVLEIKYFGSVPYIKVNKAVGIFAIIQHVFWKSLLWKHNQNREVAMVDPIRKIIVTRRGDDGYIPYDLYCHEYLHLKQIQEMGRFKFIVKHLWYDITLGYDKNPLELEIQEFLKNRKNLLKLATDLGII